jgi:hypothetical protein
MAGEDGVVMSVIALDADTAAEALIVDWTADGVPLSMTVPLSEGTVGAAGALLDMVPFTMGSEEALGVLSAAMLPLTVDDLEELAGARDDDSRITLGSGTLGEGSAMTLPTQMSVSKIWSE